MKLQELIKALCLAMDNQNFLDDDMFPTECFVKVQECTSFVQIKDLFNQWQSMDILFDELSNYFDN